jgi:Rieske Fe-S protein
MTSPSQDNAPRRRFLKWATALGGTLSAGLAGLPALRAFLSPVFRPAASGTWIKVGEAAQFDVGVPTQVPFVQTVADAWIEHRALRSVWVVTEDGEHFKAFNGRCTHLGCGYGYDATKKEFHCPCHEGVFAIATGEVLAGPPPRGLDTLKTRVDADGFLYAEYRDFHAGIPDKISS